MVSAVRRQKMAKAKAAAKAAALAAAAGDVSTELALPNEDSLKPLLVTKIVPKPIAKPASSKKTSKQVSKAPAANKKTEPINLEPKSQNIKKSEPKKSEDKEPETVDKTEDVDDEVSLDEPFMKNEPRFYLTEGCALPANWSYAVLFGKRRDLATLVLDEYDKEKLIYSWPVHLSAFARPHSPYHRAWGPFFRFAHDQCELAIKEIFDKFCPNDPTLPNDWVSLKHGQEAISKTMDVLNQLKQVFDIARDWSKYEGVIGVFNQFVTDLLDKMQSLGTHFFFDNKSGINLVVESRRCIVRMGKVGLVAAREGRIVKEEPKMKKKNKRAPVGAAVSPDSASVDSGSENDDGSDHESANISTTSLD